MALKLASHGCGAGVDVGSGENVGTAVRVGVDGTVVFVEVGTVVGVLQRTDDDDALTVFPFSVQTWLPQLKATAKTPV